MTKKIISSALAITLATSSLSALDVKSKVGVGYASAEIDSSTESSVTLDMGLKFGETIKQSLGVEFMFINDDTNSGSGNIVNFFYNVGADVYKGIVPYVSVGYMVQTFSDVDAADGLSYGAGVEYEISDNFSLDLNYKLSKMTMVTDYEYDVSIAQASIGYKF
jgi:opacity protein-like surface antigen